MIILGCVAYLRDLDLDTLPQVVIDESALQYVTKVRSLCVTFTNSLDWQVNARLVTRKVFGTLYTLRFFRHALLRDIRKYLVETLALPLFNYAATVYNHLDKDRTKKLEKDLKACVRFVLGNIPRRDHITPYRLSLGWLSAERRCQYFIGLQAFKVVANSYPPYLVERFNCTLDVDLELRRSDRRSPQHFEPPPRRTEAYEHSFALEFHSLANSIHFINFSPTNISNFKRVLREALFHRNVVCCITRVHTSSVRVLDAFPLRTG